MLFELDKNLFSLHVNEVSDLVLVDFYATWCKSCESLETYLENISEDYYGKIKVYKFNVEIDEALVDKLEIFGLPTLILFKNGVEQKRIEGLLSEKKLIEWLGL